MPEVIVLSYIVTRMLR